MAPKLNSKPRLIANCLELAILLESSAHKPGNVSIVTNFENTRYEHFVASAVAVSPVFEYAAERGIALSRNELRLDQAETGRIIEDCVKNMNAWQHGGNTLLGTIILLSPLAVAAGMTQDEEGIFNILELRKNLKQIVESTTPEDAVAFYEAIRTANPSGLGKVSDLDVNDRSSPDKILDEKVSLYQICKIASSYDTICSEWVNNFTVTFDSAYPYLTEQISQRNNLLNAVIQTFLKILSEHPDTFIARKTSLKKAEEISSQAKQVLDLGALDTTTGRESLDRFDNALRKNGNLLNPGTTADIITAALSLCILHGTRP